MMNYALPLYKNVLDKNDYQKDKDLLAFDVSLEKELPKSAQYMIRQVKDFEGYTERPVNLKNLKEDLSLIIDIFNDAWSDNWGFVKMTDAEIEHMAVSLKPVLVPDFARIAFIHDKPVAMIVALPDVNEAIHDLNGKLFPFGLFKLLWRLKVRGVKTGRVLLMGIKKEHAGTARSAAFTSHLISTIQQAALKKNYQTFEMSWILEDNDAMIRMIEMFGGHLSRRYRLFRKEI